MMLEAEQNGRANATFYNHDMVGAHRRTGNNRLKYQ